MTDTAVALRRIAAALGAGVAALAGLVLVGWLIGARRLTDLGPGLASMKANTALGLLMAGVALGLRARQPGSARGSAASGLAAAAALLGLASLLEGLLGADLGIDQLLARDLPGAVGTTAPGRMSPQTAIGLLLSGVGLWAVDRGSRGATAAQVASVVVLIDALLGIAGYLYGVDAGEGLAAPTRMAVHTTLALMALAVGIFLARPDEGPARVLTSDTSAGTFARRLLPVALGLPLVLGWARLMGERAGLYQASLGLAIFAVTNAVLLTGLVLWAARDAAAREILRRESDARYRMIVETSAEGIWLVDADDVTTFVNERMARMLGTAPGNMLGRSRFDFMGSGARARLAPRLAGAQERTPERHEVELRRADGSGVWAGASVSPLLDAGGRYQGALAMVTDLTEHRRLEELRKRADELEDSNRRVAQVSRLKTDFLANMSHELRTPLNAVIGFAELLQDGAAGEVSERQRELLGHILQGGRHLLRLINDILDLAKVEAGKIDLRPCPVRLPLVVAEVSAILREIAARRRIAVATEVDPALGEAFTDPSRLKQILYNYLSNALKFTPENGKVAVRVAPEGSESFRIEVEDGGPGVSTEDLTRLFTEFEQLDSTAAKAQQGTGLGLALTRKIATALGGRVGARTTVGQGSVFFAILPLKLGPQENAAPDRATAPLLGPRAPGPTLLVVEDDPADAAWMVHVLTEAGYAVQIAATAAEALARMAETAFDAITLDLLLPDRSGLDLLREIRSLPGGRLVPVVVVTLASDRGLARAFRVQEVLRKPVAPEDLVAALERAGARSSARCVLVVDDDPLHVEMARVALSHAGLVPVCHTDAEAALAEAVRLDLAAIVLDICMSPVDGFSFLERLRVADQRVPVVVWTGRDMTAEERERLRRGANGIVEKEGGAGKLVDELRRCLAG